MRGSDYIKDKEGALGGARKGFKWDGILGPPDNPPGTPAGTTEPRETRDPTHGNPRARARERRVPRDTLGGRGSRRTPAKPGVRYSREPLSIRGKMGWTRIPQDTPRNPGCDDPRSMGTSEGGWFHWIGRMLVSVPGTERALLAWGILTGPWHPGNRVPRHAPVSDFWKGNPEPGIRGYGLGPGRSL